MGVQRRVVIGMDPHKRSVTVEVMVADETIVGHGRFGTDVAGFAQLVSFAGQWPQRVWAIEGCEGIGRHVAQRLLAAGEQVVDVPAKLSARMRMFATGQGRKTDDTDAHSIALVDQTEKLAAEPDVASRSAASEPVRRACHDGPWPRFFRRHQSVSIRSPRAGWFPAGRSTTRSGTA